MKARKRVAETEPMQRSMAFKTDTESVGAVFSRRVAGGESDVSWPALFSLSTTVPMADSFLS